jgi:hypothetical protein
MNNSKAVNAVAVVITLAAWSGLYLFLHPQPPALDRRPHEGVGEVLAAEAMKVLEPGARIVVIARDPLPFEVPASTAQLDSFLRALKRAGQSVANIHRIQLDPLRRMAVPPGDFFELMRRGGEHDVFVSLLGPPVLEGPQLAKLGNKRPRVLALCAGTIPEQVDLQALFAQRRLTAAVITRRDAPARSTADSPQAAFEQMFTLIMIANLADLPPPTAGH